MLCHGMVWYGMVSFGMVWYGILWYDMVWYGMVWYGMVWYGMVWYGMVWYGMVWYGMVWYGMVWYGMVWYGMVWYGMIRYPPSHDPIPLMYSKPLEHVHMKLPSVFVQVPFLHILANAHSFISINVVTTGSTTKPSPLGQRCLYASKRNENQWRITQ